MYYLKKSIFRRKQGIIPSLLERGFSLVTLQDEDLNYEDLIWPVCSFLP